MDEVKRIPRASHHRGRLSLSEATSPVSTPIAAAGQPGYRGGVRSRYSLSMLSPPWSSELETPSRRDQRLSIDSPWLGERLEFPTTVAPAKPATRGETTLFRRAEELWKAAAVARQESRRRSTDAPPPTLEQRLANRRKAEQEKQRSQATPSDHVESVGVTAMRSPTKTVVAPAKPATLGENALFRRAGKCAGEVGQESLPRPIGAPRCTSMRRLARLKEAKRRRQATRNRQLQRLEGDGGQERGQSAQQRGAAEADGGQVAPAKPATLGENALFRRAGKCAGEVGQESLPRPIGAPRCTSMRRLARLKEAKRRRQATRNRQLQRLEGDGGQKRGQSAQQRGAAEADGGQKKMGVEEGSTALGRVADEETLNARKIASTGDAKMRELNRKFTAAARGALKKDLGLDMTAMISEYLAFSKRVVRTYLADHGQVFMCGNGDCGQLGFGTQEMRDMEIKAPRLLPGLAKQKVVAVACGGIATAALTEGGRVFTWGSSDDGGLGRQSGPDAPEQFPGQVKEGLEGAIVIGLGCGDCHTVALDISGKVYGWGCFRDKEGKQWFQPPKGEGAEAAKRASKLPVVIQGLPSDVAEVKCGASFCLALTLRGDVLSWGIGEIGELGREVCAMKVAPPPGSEEEPPYDFSGIVRDHITPGDMHRSLGVDGAEVVRVKDVKAIGCGDYHSMVVTRDYAEVYTCGLNSYGQLGLGDTTNRKHLTMVEELDGLNTMVVAGGAQHSLVLTTKGLFSFGRNDSGQLGCTERLSRDDWGAFEKLPMEVHLPVDAGNPIGLKCGTNHCLVITDTHELYTWGYGETCALGHGSDQDLSFPRKVDTERRGIAKVLDADGGAQHTAVLGEPAPTKTVVAPAKPATLGENALFRRAGKCAGEVGQESLPRPIGAPRCTSMRRLARLKEAKRRRQATRNRQLQRLEGDGGQEGGQSAQQRGAAEADGGQVAPAKPATLGENALFRRAGKCAGEVGQESLPRPIGAPRCTSMRRLARLKEAKRRRQATRNRQLQRLEGDGGQEGGQSAQQRGAAEADGGQKKMGVEEGSTALGRVADEETLNARKIASTGDAKMRELNRKFTAAARGALKKDLGLDMTAMISEYLAFSKRVVRTYLADHGQVFMCGNGDCGQLGFGTQEMRDMEIKAPRLLPGLAKQKVVAVACGGIATAALTEGGRVFTWGSSDDGGLGRQSGPDAPEQFPGQVKEGLEGAIVIGLGCGDCHTVALDISGKVYGWGCFRDKEGKQWFQPPKGEGAEAAKRASKLPVVIQGLPSDVAEVQCGASFCLALTLRGDVLSWGIGEIGELGREVCAMKVPPPPGSEEEPPYDFSGIVRDHITPGDMHRSPGVDGAEVVRVKDVKAIGCGEYHSMVVTRDHAEVYTCGLNSYGQLGLGDTTNRKHLTMVEELDGLNTMVVAGGAQHSLVLTTEGLFSFGRNDSGQLGCTERLSRDDWGAFENLPMEVHLPVDAGNPIRLKCGTNHCLVITDTHELYTWGYGETCALGHGSDQDLSFPRKVDTERRGIVKVLDADGGGQHTAVLGEEAPTKTVVAPAKPATLGGNTLFRRAGELWKGAGEVGQESLPRPIGARSTSMRRLARLKEAKRRRQVNRNRQLQRLEGDGGQEGGQSAQQRGAAEADGGQVAPAKPATLGGSTLFRRAGELWKGEVGQESLPRPIGARSTSMRRLARLKEAKRRRQATRNRQLQRLEGDGGQERGQSAQQRGAAEADGGQDMSPPPSSELETPSRRDRRLSIDSPWLGERLDFSTTVASPIPATCGEMPLFRRAEELWKSTAGARQESRRRDTGAPPLTLEQRLALTRRAEEAKRRSQATPSDQMESVGVTAMRSPNKTDDMSPPPSSRTPSRRDPRHDIFSPWLGERLDFPTTVPQALHLSLSEATPPVSTPIAAAGQPGYRGGVRSRYSLSMLSPPWSSELETPSRRDQRLSIDSPWLGERVEFPPTVACPKPATRGETTLFRRAEALWKSTADFRQECRRQSRDAPLPTLEQRLAWRRKAEQEK